MLRVAAPLPSLGGHVKTRFCPNLHQQARLPLLRCHHRLEKRHVACPAAASSAAAPAPGEGPQAPGFIITNAALIAAPLLLAGLAWFATKNIGLAKLSLSDIIGERLIVIISKVIPCNLTVCKHNMQAQIDRRTHTAHCTCTQAGVLPVMSKVLLLLASMAPVILVRVYMCTCYCRRCIMLLLLHEPMLSICLRLSLALCMAQSHASPMGKQFYAYIYTRTMCSLPCSCLARCMQQSHASRSKSRVPRCTACSTDCQVMHTNTLHTYMHTSVCINPDAQ